jgi:hypothetical protein
VTRLAACATRTSSGVDNNSELGARINVEIKALIEKIQRYAGNRLSDVARGAETRALGSRSPARVYNWLRVSIGIGAALLNDWQNGHGEAGDGMIGTIPGGFRRGADEREHGAMRRR